MAARTSAFQVPVCGLKAGLHRKNSTGAAAIEYPIVPIPAAPFPLDLPLEFGMRLRRKHRFPAAEINGGILSHLAADSTRW